MRKKLSIIGTVLIAILLMLIACESTPTTAPSPAPTRQETPAITPTSKPAPAPAEEDVIHITAIDLHNEAETNAIAAERKYEGKIIEVIGELDEVVRESSGNVLVSLMAEAFGGRIRCYSSGEEWEDQVVTLVKGQTITIRGEWDSWYLGWLRLKNCSVVR